MADPTGYDLDAVVPADCCPVLVPRETLRRIAERFEQALRQWRGFSDDHRGYGGPYLEDSDADDVEAHEYRACVAVSREIDALLAEAGEATTGRR